MKLIGILIIATLIVSYELPKMKKKKMQKEIMVFFIFLLFATIVSTFELDNVPLPNPLEWLKYVFEPLGKFIIGK